MNVIVDNLLVNYRREGRGPQILLLHGWGDRLETFDALVDRLKTDFEILRIDLAGFGQSQSPNTGWGLEEYVEHVQKFLLKIGASPAVILGHSHGGSIAIKSVADGILTPQNLILLSSAGIRNNDKGKKQIWKAVAKAGKVATILLPNQTKDKLRRRLYISTGSDILVSPHMEETFRRIINQDVQSDASKISIPTLIINGTNDDATPAAYAKKFHRLIQKSNLILIDGGGHFVHQEFTDEVTRRIKDFVR